ncbi:hypothetical protein KIPE111705_03925 [Kibdelosporangium persicum]|uniref:Terpene synthase n=1 Tax=Kibdelosporangium persicum TaxID=2698649 RepID=A0ABX2F720_9PSEU|nr:hypothetical protein [Kibdelosporangium persicum]NRN66585.1 Spiroviolene synthase [Kibdelosporangium persicum]
MTITEPDFEPPLFYCPIPSAINPAVDEVECRAVAWIDHIGLYRSGRDRTRILGTNSAEFYARFAPTAGSEGLLVAALWVYWGFAFDDACCDSGPLSADPSAFLAMAGQLQRSMTSSVVPTEPFAKALHDIMTRMRAFATPTQVRRFMDAHRHWLYSVAWQIGNQAQGHMPALDEYLTMRLGSAGGPPTIALLEIANNQEVPAREMDSPAVQALTEMTQLVAALDNDLHSYRKEVQEAHTDQNIVNVLMHQERSSAAEAIRRGVEIRDRIMVRFLRLRERVLAGAGPELNRYLTDLCHAIRGNIDWAARVPRYLSNGIPSPQPITVKVTTTDEPRDSSPEPLALPSISRWWDPFER